MQKKDYEMIAKAINKAKEADGNVYALITVLAVCFKEENKRFDTERFINMCLEGHKS